MQDLTIRNGKLNWIPPKRINPNKMVCDFTTGGGMKGWDGGGVVDLSADGGGMLMTVKTKATFPQCYLELGKVDWSEYKNVVIEMENIGPKAQTVIFRVRSNDDNAQRTDVELNAPKGKSVHRIPIVGLKRTKVNAISKIYLMTHQVPEEGCKIRVARIYLEPSQGL